MKTCVFTLHKGAFLTPMCRVEFSPSAYLTDTHLSRLKRIPKNFQIVTIIKMVGHHLLPSVNASI